jgi:DNA integrity scanning protein DisA with diadenylate cyclase activity
VALLEYAKITGYNNQTAAVLDSYAELLDRDLERLKAMEETERVIYIQEIKSREAVYGKMLESAAQVAGLIL